MTSSIQDRVAAVEALLANQVELPPPAVRARLRRVSGLTQTDVGEAIGVTRIQVHRWESGESDPRNPNRALYAHLLNGLAEKYPQILEEEASVSP